MGTGNDMADSTVPARRRLAVPVLRDRPEGIPVASVFCGAGGLDLGFRTAGFRTVFAADSMPAAVRSFNRNAGSDVAKEIDLLATPSEEVAAAVEAAAASADVEVRGLIGGPPCQGVSRANSRSVPGDPRNLLFERYTKTVLALEAKLGLDFFLFENVPGFRSKRNKPLYEGLVQTLGDKYELHETILDSVNFKVPQVRRRLIIVGFSKRLNDVDFSFPKPSANDPSTVRGAIAGLEAPVYFRREGSDLSKAVHANHWTSMPKSEKFRGIAPSKDGRSFIRLDWDLPSRTVAYGNREIHVHPDGNRRLSIFEALRLQGFPKSFELVGNFSEQVTQVSNAVPPPMAAAVARAVASALAKCEADSAVPA